MDNLTEQERAYMEYIESTNDYLLQLGEPDNNEYFATNVTIVGYETINGKKFPRAAWSEIGRRFNNHWIMFANPEIVNDDRMFICTVLSVCGNAHKSEEITRLDESNYNSMHMRISPYITIYGV